MTPLYRPLLPPQTPLPFPSPQTSLLWAFVSGGVGGMTMCRGWPHGSPQSCLPQANERAQLQCAGLQQTESLARERIVMESEETLPQPGTAAMETDQVVSGWVFFMALRTTRQLPSSRRLPSNRHRLPCNCCWPPFNRWAGVGGHQLLGTALGTMPQVHGAGASRIVENCQRW